MDTILIISFSRQAAHDQGQIEDLTLCASMLMCKNVKYKPNQNSKVPYQLHQHSSRKPCLFILHIHMITDPKGQIRSRQHHCPLIPRDKRRSHFILAPF